MNLAGLGSGVTMTNIFLSFQGSEQEGLNSRRAGFKKTGEKEDEKKTRGALRETLAFLRINLAQF